MVDIIGGGIPFEIEALIADRMLGKTNSFVLDGRTKMLVVIPGNLKIL
jgi:hypothetical protein